MTTPQRLVILGTNLTALALARSASRRGIESCVVDVAVGPASKSRLATCFVDGSRSRASLLQQVCRLGAERASWLVSTADAWSFEIIAKRQELESAFARILQPSNEALAICLSKTEFAAWCAVQKIPAPRQYRFDPASFEIADDIVFPLFVRPAVTQHARRHPGIAKATEIHTPRDLRACLQAFEDAKLVPAISESLLGRNLVQVSVGAAMTEGRSMTLVARKVRPLAKACRVGSLVETTTDADAEALALTALHRLGYEGIAEVEILKDADTGRMYVIEINARPWIQFGLAEAAGRDLLGFLLAGGRVDAPAAQKSRVWLDFSGDLWNCFNRCDGLVRRRSVSFPAYLRSLLRARVYARWSARDPLPFVTDAMASAGSTWRSLRQRRAETTRNVRISS